jgi:hypothetical protein
MDVLFKNVPASRLDDLLAVLRPIQPELLNIEWSVEAAETLLRYLGPAQRNLIVSTARAGGRLGAKELRDRTATNTLKGLTGPISKAMERLTQSGKLSIGLPKPVGALRDPTARSWEKTGSFVMDQALVPVFLEAGRRVEES